MKITFQSTYLFRTTIICGLIPMLGGLGIFLTWWAARAWFTVDFSYLQVLGFFWLFPSFIVAIIGVLSIPIYVIKFRRYYNEVLATLAIILFNIPVLYWVLDTRYAIDQRIYFQLYNDTGSDVKLVIKGKKFENNLGELTSGQSLHSSYLPTFVYADARAYNYDDVKLIITYTQHTDTLHVPRLRSGCVHLHITPQNTLVVDELDAISFTEKDTSIYKGK